MNMKFKTLHILGNWNMHLYTQFSFLSRIECEKHWERIRNQETGECFFSHWCLNLSVIFIKEAYHIKLKKTNYGNWNFGKRKERDREGLTCTHYQELSHNLRRVRPWIQLLWILLRIPASGHWRDWVLLLFLLLLRKIKQVTDLIPVALTAKWIVVLVLPLGWVGNPS